MIGQSYAKWQTVAGVWPNCNRLVCAPLSIWQLWQLHCALWQTIQLLLDLSQVCASTGLVNHMWPSVFFPHCYLKVLSLFLPSWLCSRAGKEGELSVQQNQAVAADKLYRVCIVQVCFLIKYVSQTLFQHQTLSASIFSPENYFQMLNC